MSTHRTLNFNEKIGLNIRNIRQRHKLSQTELATRIGVSFQQVQKYETGANQVSAQRLCQIAAALNVPPDILLALAQQSPPSPADAEQRLLQNFRKIGDASTQWLLLELLQILAKAR